MTTIIKIFHNSNDNNNKQHYQDNNVDKKFPIIEYFDNKEELIKLRKKYKKLKRKYKKIKNMVKEENIEIQIDELDGNVKKINIENATIDEKIKKL